MATIGSASFTSLYSMFGKMQKDLAKAKAVEQAAQQCTDFLYGQFKDSLALVRIYTTIPYGALPASNKAFVDGLAKAKQVTVSDSTPVLSLLGTRGSKPDWNDRKKSQGHVGIPLTSSAFVESIPMVARLFSDLGVKLDWIDKPDGGFTTTRADWSGLFHVPDAKTTKDVKSRHVIPAQDFVAEQSVKTVFGVGASYPSATMFATILFTREDIPKETAERFMPLATTFKAATADMVASSHFFV